MAFASTIVVGAVLSLSACGTPTPSVALFADYVPVLDRTVSTDLVPIHGPESADFLGHGWEMPPPADEVAPVRWVVSEWASLRFYVAVDGGVTLELEGQPADDESDAGQQMLIELNDVPVARVQMASGWSTYEIELPQPVIELGWNRVVLRFSRRVVSADPDGVAAAGPRAAGFRYVRIRSALGRPFWPEQPRTIDVVSVDEAGAAARLDMPTDSFLELVIDAGGAFRVDGTGGGGLCRCRGNW